MEEPDSSLIKGMGNEVLVCVGLFIIIVPYAIKRFSAYLDNLDVADVNQVAPDRVYNNETCPICLSSPSFAVETNCGHKFCGTCIREYINNREPTDFLFTSLPCPMCRQSMNLLMTSFSAVEISGESPEKAEVLQAVRQYNITYGNGQRSFMRYIRDCPILLRHLASQFFTLRGFVWFFRFRVILCFVVCLIYLISPIDAIPEAMVGAFGLVDDIIVLVFCAIYISTIYRHFILQNANAEDS